MARNAALPKVMTQEIHEEIESHTVISETTHMPAPGHTITVKVEDSAEWREKMANIQDFAELQLAYGTWDHSPYQHGMANGVIAMISILLGKRPMFLRPPVNGYANNSGAEQIARTRQRTMAQYGYDDAHDDDHDSGELAIAAAAYLEGEPAFWPWDKDSFKMTDRKSDLVKAGVLIASEIDRIDRMGSDDRSHKGSLPSEVGEGLIGSVVWCFIIIFVCAAALFFSGCSDAPDGYTAKSKWMCGWHYGEYKCGYQTFYVPETKTVAR